MDMANAFETLNWLAIFVAAISSFLLGGVWYSKALFGKAWMRACGFTEEELQQNNMAKVFGISFVLALFAAFNLAMFIGPEADIAYGATAGFLAGIGWVATMGGIPHYLFERRSLAHFLINAGYSTVALTVMGVILEGKITCEVKYAPENIRPAKYKAFFATHGQVPLQVIYHVGQPPKVEKIKFLRF